MGGFRAPHITMKVQVTFTESEIISILRQHLQREGFKINGKHTVRTTKQYYGQREEYSKDVFGGITFDVEKVSNSNNYFDR